MPQEQKSLDNIEFKDVAKIWFDRQPKYKQMLMKISLYTLSGAIIFNFAADKLHLLDKTNAHTQPVASIAAPTQPVLAKRSLRDRIRDLQPFDQRAVVDANVIAQAAAANASNDMQKGAVRRNRAQEICAAVSNLSANQWIGRLNNIGANGDGKGVLSVEIAPGVLVKTWNNSFSDIGDGTLIDPSSKVFSAAASMKTGDYVIFSGKFFSGNNDCIKENSMTLSGSLDNPEYLFRFTSISRVEP